MILFNTWVMSLLVPITAASVALALHERNMPEGRWLRSALIFYMLPSWLWVDVAFVYWRDFLFQHTCHDFACRSSSHLPGLLLNYCGMVGIEIGGLAMVALAAAIRFRRLEIVFGW